MSRVLLSTIALIAISAVSAVAQSPAPVDCGSVTCFRFRVPAEGKDPETRAGAAMDTINKYLGGKIGKVSIKPAGRNVRLLLNNELVAVITPADARAENKKSVAALAGQWSHSLGAAFEATKAQK